MKFYSVIFMFLFWIVLLTNAQKRMDCPDFIKAKSIRDGKKPKENHVLDVKLVRGMNTVKFNVIKLDDRKLEIPAFKQFKNNMTDFTADGEEEFKRLVLKLRAHLGPNTTGEGVTLEIIGSASQIPTSFDPSKPNNNISDHGSSILGQTSIENNKLLALARATELGKKIKLVFPEVILNIPNLADIQLGSTPWDENTQKRLNMAVKKKDQKMIEDVYSPFQKEQFVMVRTKDYKTEFIQPEAVHSYYILLSPNILWTDQSGSHNISHFVVSEWIYKKIGENKTFSNVEERDEYLKNVLHTTVYHPTYLNTDHWFMFTSKEATSLRKREDYKVVKSLYFENKVFDFKDKKVLEEIVINEMLQTVQ